MLQISIVIADDIPIILAGYRSGQADSINMKYEIKEVLYSSKNIIVYTRRAIKSRVKSWFLY